MEVATAEPELQNAVEERAYARLLSQFGDLQPAIDRFFDEVLVMAEDIELRSTRLALLNTIAKKVSVVADLTKLVIAGK